MIGICELCERNMFLTLHHLIPKKLHKQCKKKKLYNDNELLQTVSICRQCHSAIHRIFTHDELAYTYNSIDKYYDNEDVIKWINYASKQQECDMNRQKYGLKWAK